MSPSFLQDALVYLAAAIGFVPLAKRLGLSSVLGYLLAGVTIGPSALGLVGGQGQAVLRFAEFGVVMMLFLIGLELEPAHFWRMRRTIAGAGATQMGLTTLLCLPLFHALGLSWSGALAVGLALSMSSTAIVLQSLREKGIAQTQSGRSAFAVLLFQDISVIPILALLPLLAATAVRGGGSGHGGLMADWPGWAQTLAVLGAVGVLALGGRYLVVPGLRFIARARLRELFTAAALFIVLAAAYLMEIVGLSPALGTFLAGVVLANSEFRHELEGDIEPFKGILLGLFFLSVGAAIDFSLVLARPGTITALVLGVVALKAVALLVTGRLVGLAFDQNLLFALGLAQVGEFAFVLWGFMGQLALLPADWIGTLVAVTALTMAATPLVMLLNERLILPRFGTRERAEAPADAIDRHHPVIIAGFGPFGSVVGRFLRANGVEATILDNDSDRVELLRRMGFQVFYGDATRLEILEAAGADRARLLVAAIGLPEVNRELVARVRRRFPHLRVLVRAQNRREAFEFLDLGVGEVYRESFDTAVRLGVDVLVGLGRRRYSALRAGQAFFRYDEEAMRRLAAHRHDRSAFIFNVREEIQLQEALLASDREANPSLHDHAWDSDRRAQPPGPAGTPEGSPASGGESR